MLSSLRNINDILLPWLCVPIMIHNREKIAGCYWAGNTARHEPNVEIDLCLEDGWTHLINLSSILE